MGYLRHSNFIRCTFHPAVEDLARPDSAFHRLRFHDLRYSAASIWIQRGVPATVVAAQLSHSTPAFTLRTSARKTWRVLLTGFSEATGQKLGRSPKHEGQ